MFISVSMYMSVSIVVSSTSLHWHLCLHFCVCLHFLFPFLALATSPVYVSASLSCLCLFLSVCLYICFMYVCLCTKLKLCACVRGSADLPCSKRMFSYFRGQPSVEYSPGSDLSFLLTAAQWPQAHDDDIIVSVRVWAIYWKWIKFWSRCDCVLCISIHSILVHFFTKTEPKACTFHNKSLTIVNLRSAIHAFPFP